MDPGPLFDTVLVLLGLDRRDLSVIDAVVAGAERFGTRRVVLLHVHSLAAIPTGLAGVVELSAPDRGAVLEALRHELSLRIPNLSLEVHARDGSTAEQLVELAVACDADLVVLGRETASGGRSVWGPHGLALLRHAPCSVLIVPDGARLDLRGGVVGLDFSEHAVFALQTAVRLFEQVRAVYQFDVSAAALGELTDGEFELHLAENVRDHFDREILPSLPPATAEPHIEILPAGAPSDALVAAAGHGPLVLGSRGLSRLAALLLGSTAEAVAGRASGPIFVIRKKSSAGGLIDHLMHTRGR